MAGQCGRAGPGQPARRGRLPQPGDDQRLRCPGAAAGGLRLRRGHVELHAPERHVQPAEERRAAGAARLRRLDLLEDDLDGLPRRPPGRDDDRRQRRLRRGDRAGAVREPQRRRGAAPRRRRLHRPLAEAPGAAPRGGGGGSLVCRPGRRHRNAGGRQAPAPLPLRCWRTPAAPEDAADGSDARTRAARERGRAAAQADRRAPEEAREAARALAARRQRGDPLRARLPQQDAQAEGQRDPRRLPGEPRARARDQVRRARDAARSARARAAVDRHGRPQAQDPRVAGANSRRLERCRARLPGGCQGDSATSCAARCFVFNCPKPLLILTSAVANYCQRRPNRSPRPRALRRTAKPMTVKRALVTALLALAALPASASAQAQIDPPGGDAYLDSLIVSSPTDPLKLNTPVGFIADTTSYTIQSDMANPPGSGGPPEPNQCGTVVYGNTVWSAVYFKHYGRLKVTTSGPFDSVIGAVPFHSLSDALPQINRGSCYDGLTGFDENASFLVAPKQWWAIQVGGVGPSGGKIQVKFEMKKPPAVAGQAFLFWKTGPLRVSDMYVKSIPKGQKITLSCTKHACGKRTISVKSKPAAKSHGKRFVKASAASLRAVVREAKARVEVLKNHKVKSGAKIELRLSRPGYIGKYYVWKVSGNSIGAAKTLCMNPGSTKPRKKCNG